MYNPKLAPLPWAVDMKSVGAMWTDSISIADANGMHVMHFTRGYECDQNGQSRASIDIASMVVDAVNAFAGGRWELWQSQTPDLSSCLGSESASPPPLGSSPSSGCSGGPGAGPVKP